MKSDSNFLLTELIMRIKRLVVIVQFSSALSEATLREKILELYYQALKIQNNYDLSKVSMKVCSESL